LSNRTGEKADWRTPATAQDGEGFNLALRLELKRSAADTVYVIDCDVTGAIVTQHARPMPHMRLTTSWNSRFQVKRIDDVLNPHGGAAVLGNDVTGIFV
jgi:hypothetical protein